MKLPLYYDYACPWAYLGSARAEAYFAEVGADDRLEAGPPRDAQGADAGQAPRDGRSEEEELPERPAALGGALRRRDLARGGQGATRTRGSSSAARSLRSTRAASASSTTRPTARAGPRRATSRTRRVLRGLLARRRASTPTRRSRARAVAGDREAPRGGDAGRDRSRRLRRAHRLRRRRDVLGQRPLRAREALRAEGLIRRAREVRGPRGRRFVPFPFVSGATPEKEDPWSSCSCSCRATATSAEPDAMRADERRSRRSSPTGQAPARRAARERGGVRPRPRARRRVVRARRARSPESKEVIGGFWIVDVPDRDEAIEIAKRAPARALGHGRGAPRADALDVPRCRRRARPSSSCSARSPGSSTATARSSREMLDVRRGARARAASSSRPRRSPHEPPPARVEVRGGQALVIDGPFAEAKEAVGGYSLVRVADATPRRSPSRSAIPHARWGPLEVRRDPLPRSREGVSGVHYDRSGRPRGAPRPIAPRSSASTARSSGASSRP